MRDRTSRHAGRRTSPRLADHAGSRDGLARDLATARRRIATLEADARKHTRVLATQRQVLESLARGKPLSQALAALVRTVEAQCPGVIGSVLLLEDGKRLRHGAAPGLPETFNQALDGVCIGPSVGSCGTAAYRRETVIVSDIATDPLWASFRDLALENELRACWSQPIFSAKDDVLGTLAMYYPRPQSPSEADQDYIEIAAFLAGIAIERHRADEERLIRERRRLRQTEQLIKLTRSDAVVHGDFSGFQERATRVAAHLLDVERVSIWSFRDDRRVLHCDQLYEATPDRHSSGKEIQSSDFPCYFAALEGGRTVAANDARSNEATREFTESYLKPEGITSMLDAPIRRAGDVVGVVCHEHVGAQRVWTDEEREFAAALGDFVSRELEADERRHAEAQLRSTQQELLRQQWQATQQVSSQLARAKDELVRQTRLATVGQVAASIAHELRNPLEAIDKAEYVLSRQVPHTEVRWRKYLDIIRQEVRAADDIVGNLLEASTAKAPLKTSIPLVEAVRESLARARATGSVHLQMDFDPDPFMVNCDPVQLRQVLSNVLANAVEAMEDDGLIVVRARRLDDMDRISVTDDGPGIEQAVRDRIFEPLFTTKAKGTGLGLAICRQICEGHGGSIELGEPDDGRTTFVLQFPHTPQAPSTDTPST